MSKKPRRIIISAGGTGGHVFPAQALAKKLCDLDWEVHFVSESRGSRWEGFDSRLIRKKISTGELGRGNLVQKLLASLNLLIGILQSIMYIFKVRPHCVIGFGGYPSFPVLVASLFYPTKRIVHEQNAVLGRVNRWMMPFIHKVACSFPIVQKGDKISLVGMPVRDGIVEASNIPYPGIEKEFIITVLGGSQGAKIFSDSLPSIFKKISEETDLKLKIIQQCREELLDSTRMTYKKTGLDYEITPFIDPISAVLKKTHLVISRAGASTIAEVMNMGRPSILVPYPLAMDDHQRRNAEFVQEKGACWVLEDKELRSGKLDKLLLSLIQDIPQLKKAALCARQISPRNATDKLVDLIMKETSYGKG